MICLLSSTRPGCDVALDDSEVSRRHVRAASADALSVAAGFDGSVHATYRSGNVLYHARREADGTWTGQVVPNASGPGDSTATAIDSPGGIHVFYADSSRRLRHAYSCITD